MSNERILVVVYQFPVWKASIKI